MPAILDHIQSLETYAERSGARLQRASLPECVHGRVFCDVITLRAGLSPLQELVAMVHELAHWLVHRDPRSGLDCTLFEYEAEAVEALVMARLELPGHARPCGAFGRASPTDNLLSASVSRVMRASSGICAALGVSAELSPSEAQPSIQLEDEPYGMSDFLGLPEAF